MNTRRTVIAISLWLVAALSALLWSVDWRPGLPGTADKAATVPAEAGHAPPTTLAEAGPGRRLEGRAADGIQLLWLGDSPIDAGSARFLHLCVGAMAAEQRLLVAVGAAGRLHWLPVPRPWLGQPVVDLSVLEAWQGEVSALGVGWLPVDYLPAAAAPQRQPQVCAAQLRADNLVSRLLSEAGQWFGGRGWTGRSINSAGLELGAAQAVDYLPIWVALGVLGMLLASWAGSPATARGVLVVVLLLPLGNELLQQASRAQAAGVAAESAARADLALSAMPAWSAELASMGEALRAAMPARVLVVAEASFAREYPVWLLREFNAGGAQPTWLGDFASLRTEGAVLLVQPAEGWRLEGGLLRRQTLQLPAEHLFEGRQWLAVRLLPAASSP